MTGPAKFAWIIAVFCMWWSPVLVCAASPRDAVRDLPTFTHQSIFETSSSGQADSASYQDNYTGKWTVNWNRAFELGQARTNLHLQYERTITDYLNKGKGTSSDTDSDKFTSELRLKFPKNSLAALLKFHHASPYTGQGHTEHDRVWSPDSTWEYRLNLNLPNLPSLAFLHSINRSASYKGSNLTRSTESSITTIAAEFKPDNQFKAHGLGERYYVYSEMSESKNLLAGLSNQGSGEGNNTRKMRMEGTRQWNVGQLGNLVTGYTYEERSTGSPANITPSNTYSTQYFIGLDGRVQSMPLRYSFKYQTEDLGFSGGTSGRLNTYQHLNFTFSPPVPDGKSASLQLNHFIKDYQDPLNFNRNENHTMLWTFSPNPQVNSSVKYEMNTDTKSASGSRTKEQEKLTGQMVYQIPGNRGTMTTSYVQDVTRQPSRESVHVRDSFSVNQRFNLGDRATMNLFLNQTYDDNRSSIFIDPDGLDTLQAGFNYSIDDGRFINLQTGWNTRLQQKESGRKSSRDSLNVNFSFSRGDNWSYQLVVDTANESKRNLNEPTASDYSANDNIQATITYSF